ncbi:MAG TPA: cache domain-containing protein [Nocardioidaceae bacterium]
MPASTTTLAPAAEQVTALFEEIFAGVDRIRRRLEHVFAAGPVDAAAALAVVEPDARRLLDAGTVLGAGYVAAPDALTDRTLYLAWWQGDDQQLLGESEAPASGAPFDYTRREWFRVPAESGRRHVTGPYVDFVCTDEYVVTCTAPVLVDGRVVGVAGADVLVETLEDLLLKPLSDAGATLVGEHGRAVVSADHRIAPGTVLDLTDLRERVLCSDLPLSVVLRG